ncbi:MAG: MTH1187 family thiamine-binding protein [Gemmatimonadota bacterium]|nr:MAG: MTH1187 family thiamine-binding protein [Gemmatimonadota bacterium]
MKATAEIQVVPIGVGVSVRKEVKRAHEILRDTGLDVQLHAYGTNVEGELADILDAVRRVHETLHAEGVVRISTALKLGTRTDKEPSLGGKLF